MTLPREYEEPGLHVTRLYNRKKQYFMPAMNYAPIATLYDAYVRTAVDIPFFEEASRGYATVLELMSGTGRVSVPLIRSGVNLTCVDNSADMLAILRQKLHAEGLAADVYEMDVCALSLGRTFDMSFIPFHSFAEIVSPEDQRKALRAIHTHLRDAGQFICTLHNPPVRLKSVDGVLHLRGKYLLEGQSGILILWSVEQYDPSSRLVTGLQLYEMYNDAATLTARSYVDIQFYVHDHAGFEELLTSEGFKVKALYGDYDRSAFREDESPVMIWVLQKA